MQAIPFRFSSCSKSTFIVTVTSYTDKLITGYIHMPYDGTTVQFQNAMQMLFIMESMMDETGYPQRGMEPRAFRDELPEAAKENQVFLQTIPSGIAGLQIDVIFRQNASWQGNLIWIDRKVQSHFRSALELLGLIDDALEMVVNNC